MRVRTTGALLVLAVGVAAAAGLAQETAPPATAPPATAPPATDDPRVGLAPGFRDAGQALRNMELVTTLPSRRASSTRRTRPGSPCRRGR